MELQFQKKLIPCLKTVLHQVQTQEQTQEVRLPEGMPDIGRIISSWGQVLIRGKEWRSGGMSVSGGVMVWVLYGPEDGSEPRCLEAWLPFQIKWDFLESEPDGTIMALPLLRSVDARSTSARKVMVRASVSILGQALCDTETAVYEPEEIPEDLCVLKNVYPLCLPSEAGEKAFSVEETITVPETMMPPVRLIRYELRPEITEQKIMTDKLIFRGSAILHVLYADADGHLHNHDYEIPFSQYAELNRDHADGSKVVICPAVTNLEMELGPTGEMILKAGLTGQYTIFDCTTVQMVEDSYSPIRRVQTQISELKAPAVLEDMSRTILARQAVENSDDQVVDVAFYPEHPRMYREADQTGAELSGTFQVLCQDPEGQFHNQVSRWEDTWSMPAASNVRAEAVITPTGMQGADDTGTEVQAQLQMNIRTTGETGLSMVSGVELGETGEKDPDRPSLILCRKGTGSLWDMAKRTGSTVEAIMKANNLQQEPDENKVLLIPVS